MAESDEITILDDPKSIRIRRIVQLNGCITVEPLNPDGGDLWADCLIIGNLDCHRYRRGLGEWSPRHVVINAETYEARPVEWRYAGNNGLPIGNRLQGPAIEFKDYVAIRELFANAMEEYAGEIHEPRPNN